MIHVDAAVEVRRQEQMTAENSDEERSMPALAHAKILVAVRSRRAQTAIARALAYLGDLTVVDDGWSCVRLAHERSFDLILVASDLTNMKGREAVLSLRGESRLAQLPIVFLADARDRASGAVAGDRRLILLPDEPIEEAKLVYVVMKLLAASEEEAWQALPERQRIALVAARQLYDRLARQRGHLSGEDMELVRSTAASLVRLVHEGDAGELLTTLHAHDDATFAHTIEVAVLLARFGVALDVPAVDVHILSQAGLLHDIGKLAIPLPVLVKPAPLDAREWAIMRRHPGLGAELLRPVPEVPRTVVAAVESHHERLDGSGYPGGLKGSEIDDVALLTAVADVFAALTDRRPYKRSMSPDEAFKIMREMSGRHLEPGFTDRFIEVVSA